MVHLRFKKSFLGGCNRKNTRDSFDKTIPVILTPIHLAIENKLGPNEIQTISNTYWKSQKKAPIHLAIENKNIEIVQLLLNHPQIDVNLPFLYEGDHNFLEKYSIKKSSICVAIDADCSDIFQLLINHNDVNASYEIVEEEHNEARGTYESKFYPLHLAAKKGNPLIIKSLKPDIDVNDPYKYSCEKGYSVYRGMELTSIKKTPLSLAIENEDVEIIELLLARENIDANISFEYKSNYTIKKNNAERKKETVKILSPLFVAVQKDNDRIVEDLLIKSQINLELVSIIDEENETYRKTAIELAYEKGNEKIISLLEN